MQHQTSPLFAVKGQVIILTGGCGLLGSEYARSLAQEGARVVIADLRLDSAEALAAELRAREGEALAVQVDVSSKPSVQALVERVRAEYGRIDVLVNNAAIDPKFDPKGKAAHSSVFEDYPLEMWNQSLAVNVTGMFLCAQSVAPQMLSQGKGVIINISSMYGMVGPNQGLYQSPEGEAPVFKPVAYSVTKSAVLGLTKYLATYWGGKGIRVNTLTLGGVFAGHDEGFLARYGTLAPMGRMADRSEYCGALIFLASDASSYMTGANLVVDGGWTAW